MKNSAIALGLISCVGLSGCAGIINGTSDNITVRSANPDATLYVDGMSMGKDTVMFSQKRGKKIILEAKAPNCSTGVTHTDWKFDVTSLLGIFIDFGILSIPIDFATGGAMAPEQTIYTVNPICAEI